MSWESMLIAQILGLVGAQTPLTPTLPLTPVKPPIVGQFPAAEKQKAMDFWSQPNRYLESPPDKPKEVGLWQVRETVAGSTWIYNYNRARKVSAPPTQDAQAANSQQAVWDAWIQSKVAYDRWFAGQIALKANLQILGTAPSKADPSVPLNEPPLPGPIPPDLETLAGAPPRFAEAVVPMLHRIDFGDAVVSYYDNVKLGNPKYPYYRFASGVNDEGTPVRTISQGRIDSLFDKAGIDTSTEKVMEAVSMLEGGFDSINTYDTGYVSVGFIQFACLREGAGSLGEFLSQYKHDSPDKFENDLQRYGVDVTSDGVLDVIDPDSGGEFTGPSAAQRIIDDKRLIAVFGHAAQTSDDFIAAQIKAAKTMFYPADDEISIPIDGVDATGKVSDIIRSEAGMATLMDRKVNTGNLKALNDVLQQIATQNHVTNFSDFAKYELQIVTAMRYRKNYLSDPTLSQPAPLTPP